MVAGVLALTACQGTEATPSASDSTPSTDPGSSTPAESGEPTAAHSYEDGDQITYVVPFAAGGGQDTYARTLAPYLQAAIRDITGAEVTVVVQNVDGARGIVGMEQVYRETGSSDHIIQFTSDVHAELQVSESPGFDLQELTPLAQISSEDRALIIRPGVLDEDGTFDDLVARSQEEPILWGGATNSRLFVKVLEDNGVDLSIELVEFPGTPEAIASLLRNEIEIFTVSLPTAVEQVEANPSLRLLVNTGGPERSDLAPDVPTLEELGVPGADYLARTLGTSARVIAGPPEMPEADAAVLEEALATALNDAEFLAEMEAGGNPVVYGDAAAARDLIDGYLEVYIENQDLLTGG